MTPVRPERVAQPRHRNPERVRNVGWRYAAPNHLCQYAIRDRCARCGRQRADQPAWRRTTQVHDRTLDLDLDRTQDTTQHSARLPAFIWLRLRRSLPLPRRRPQPAWSAPGLRATTVKHVTPEQSQPSRSPLSSSPQNCATSPAVVSPLSIMACSRPLKTILMNETLFCTTWVMQRTSTSPASKR